MLKGGLRAGKVRGEGAHGGFQAWHEAAPRETLPRAARIKVAASRRDSQKSPTRIGENAPDLPGKWGVSALKLWAVFAPWKSALKKTVPATDKFVRTPITSAGLLRYPSALIMG